MQSNSVRSAPDAAGLHWLLPPNTFPVHDRSLFANPLVLISKLSQPFQRVSAGRRKPSFRAGCGPGPTPQWKVPSMAPWNRSHRRPVAMMVSASGFHPQRRLLHHFCCCSSSAFVKSFLRCSWHLQTPGPVFRASVLKNGHAWPHTPCALANAEGSAGWPSGLDGPLRYKSRFFLGL